MPPVCISDRERQALLGMATDTESSCSRPFYSFDIIAQLSGLPRLHVRRAVRALARKGLTEFGKGLWTDCGEPRGAGYALTDAGWDRAEQEAAHGR